MGVAIVQSDNYIVYMSNSTTPQTTQTPDSEIAGRILTALSDKTLTQGELAQEIGISHTTLRRGLEQHRGDSRSFTIRELGKIAAALNVPTSTLLPAELAA